ncbi:Histone acetyltransferase KAT7 [Grifola frondosa]|uniref:Histone acetyltransferase n=1 Tax=Grifola frondosa TaxID=5627 RepID=A0A1C7M7D8_GRIFR|nr:Histone acetyltransferase KAT7 [Grifola frondosa]
MRCSRCAAGHGPLIIFMVSEYLNTEFRAPYCTHRTASSKCCPTADFLPATKSYAAAFASIFPRTQGDPFAEPPPAYLPVEEPAPPPTKPLKRKRRPPPREEECGFCHGDDTKNKTGVPELLVSCAECGRSGHPSCMQLPGLGDMMRSYPWKCAECKSCEVCQQKRDDSTMLICDFCDRGWHMACLRPPLLEPPDGQWHCPICPPFPPPSQLEIATEPYFSEVMLQSPSLPQIPPRESSVASSSRIIQEQDESQQHIAVSENSDMDVDGTDLSPGKKRKSKKKSRWKGKEPMRDIPEEVEDPLSSSLPSKRMRIRLSSPVPPPDSSPAPLPKTVIRFRIPARGKGKARDDGQEDGERSIFEDILGTEDRDVTSTLITNGDKQRFERCRLAAEGKIFPPPAPATPQVLDTTVAGPSSRPLRSAAHHHPPPAANPIPAFSTSPAPSTPDPQNAASPNGLRIRRIRFGEFDIETWYDAPFPEEYANIPDGRLWICEFCLKYMKSRFSAGRHQMKCKTRHPPGDEIYRDGVISIFEVDGRKNKIYCQNLCLLSKMFLDHKSLFYDVEPFLFYVMTEVDESGARFVGYFSKEKLSPKYYNVSCIMTLPVRQRQGWGNLLIDFSYLLSKKEQRAGSPEKPLSALGALGYKNYWTLSLMRYLHSAPPNPRLEDISAATSLTIEDIHTTLTQLRMIAIEDTTPLRGRFLGKPSSSQRDGRMALHASICSWDPEDVAQYLAKWETKGYLKLKPEKLKWSPFIVARTKRMEQLLSTDAAANAADGEANGRTTESAADPQTSRPEPALETAESAGSPVCALFDDDNVEIVSATAQAPSIVLPQTPQVRSPSAEPEEQAQAEKGRTLAKKLARSSPTSSRHLRNRGKSATPQPPRVEYLHEERPVNGDRRKSTHRMRSNAQVNGHNDSDSIAQDAALAAKLALEEGRPRRQLRSRSNTEQDTKRPISSPRSASPRKRRRGSRPLPKLNRAKSTPSKVQRRSSRVANGSAVANNISRPAAQVVRGGSAPRMRNLHEKGEAAEIMESEPPDEAEREHERPADPPTEDMKYEDADTPLTGLTSRHSAPSDDTVIALEGITMKVSPVGPVNVAEVEPPPTEQDRALNDSGLDEGGDEDAEGEEDVDAEGEPDLETL